MTDAPPQEQAMTDTEQPSQWAVELLHAVHDVSDIGSACGAVNCPQCAKAALAIQRAFAEREAELVGALRAAISALEDDTGLDEAICCSGHECGCRGSSHRQLLTYNLSTTLKSREAGHG